MLGTPRIFIPGELFTLHGLSHHGGVPTEELKEQRLLERMRPLSINILEQDENGMKVERAELFLLLGRTDLVGKSFSGKSHNEPGPLARGAFNGNFTAVQPYHLVSDGESYSAPTFTRAFSVRPIKAFEDMRQIGGGDTGSGVFNSDADVALRGDRQ